MADTVCFSKQVIDDSKEEFVIIIIIIIIIIIKESKIWHICEIEFLAVMF